MRAAIYDSFGGPINIETVDDPACSETGVIIKVLANGICRSDWHGWQGHDAAITLPNVPGHECCGEVLEVGADVQNWRVGDHVIVPFSGGCGTCPSCKVDNQHICDNDFQPGFSAFGAFAEYCAIEYADVNLVRLPEAMLPTTAASLGCRFMTSFRAIARRARVANSDWLAVHGAGGIGLSSIMIAKAFGARVIAVDIRSEALEFAKRLGAEVTLNAQDIDDIPEAIVDITKGGAHASIDALGSPITAYNSIACLRKRGRHVQIGLAVGDHRDMAVPMGLVIGRELDILGSHGMQAHKYPDMLDMIAEGRLRPELLVDKTVSLQEGAEILVKMGDQSPDGVAVIDSF